MSLCDQCENYTNNLLIAWGRELTDVEKDVNAMFVKEGKAEYCSAYERYFNKNFKKRVTMCAECFVEGSVCKEETTEANKP